MIIVCQTLLKNTKINGITLFPFIILSNKLDKDNKVLLNHEKIHIRQQLELLIIFFYIWYVVEYFYHFVKLKNGNLAYRSISFEKEAYANENNFDYLDRRNLWTFWKYI
ncbi:hypothetical protein [Frigoriflavimonas asaccharolytica]|uniref:Beta-lactamase regulating signal transducer with metallopeptidase domain n=1 Tax=Frigoriflavimonas asaccharolytica TaxID=2735899 RepID=A0A8J8G887_9FLAO|nr:hypothetical protein [Frigoriflavimonas asaccharolytica]NRS93086.1 hypothetical protein [Frigoriflavimonas asaccharolytica]